LGGSLNFDLGLFEDRAVATGKLLDKVLGQLLHLQLLDFAPMAEVKELIFTPCYLIHIGGN
jgi:hypothetical protein